VILLRPRRARQSAGTVSRPPTGLSEPPDGAARASPADEALRRANSSGARRSTHLERRIQSQLWHHEGSEPRTGHSCPPGQARRVPVKHVPVTTPQNILAHHGSHTVRQPVAAFGCAVTPALRRNRYTVTGGVRASLFGRMAPPRHRSPLKLEADARPRSWQDERLTRSATKLQPLRSALSGSVASSKDPCVRRRAASPIPPTPPAARVYCPPSSAPDPFHIQTPSGCDGSGKFTPQDFPRRASFVPRSSAHNRPGEGECREKLKKLVCCAPQRAPLIALSRPRGLGLVFSSKSINPQQLERLTRLV
jgi:hypothetical protein